MRRVALLAILVGVLAGAGGRPAAADGGDLEEASKLRQQADGDWHAKRYAEAAVKLRRAAAIYERAPEKHVADLATVRRALVWNLVRGGDPAGAGETFASLLALYASDGSVRSHVLSAYQALYEVGRDAQDLARAKAVLEPVREAALAAKVADIASQVLHDLGSISRDRGDHEQAASYFDAAIEERRRNHERLGEAWSLNNRANLDADGDRWQSAMAPLLAAQRIVFEDRIAAPARAIAANVKTVLSKVDATPPPPAAVARWLADLAEAGVASDMPAVIPTDHLLRRAFRAALANAKDGAGRLEAAQALAGSAKRRVGVPPETRADLLLLASKVALDDGHTKDAAAWLAGLDVGKGPASPHLAARAAVERARLAVAGAAEDPGARIAEARGVLASLGDRALLLSGLSALAKAARAAGLASLGSEVEKEREDEVKKDGPGARGATARGGGNPARYRTLGLLDGVFEIRFDAGRISIKDTLVEGPSLMVEVLWQPMNLAIDGLSLAVFGGYVVVTSLDYGAAAIVSGSAPEATLEELGAYLPVPATGAIRVHVNGSVSYAE